MMMMFWSKFWSKLSQNFESESFLEAETFKGV